MGSSSDNELLQRLVLEQVRKDERYIPVETGGIVIHGETAESMADDAHIVVASTLPIQISCRLSEKGVIAQTFFSPRVIEPEKRGMFVELANAVNVASIDVGALAVDDLDLGYQVGLRRELFRAAPDEARRVLFERGVEILESICLPVCGLSSGAWPMKKVLRFVHELYEKGWLPADEWL